MLPLFVKTNKHWLARKINYCIGHSRLSIDDTNGIKNREVRVVTHRWSVELASNLDNGGCTYEKGNF